MLLRASLVACLLLQAAAGHAQTADVINACVATASGRVRVVEAWRECLAWMQREVDLCKRHAIPIVLLVTPVDFQFVDESRTFAQRRLHEFAARNGVGYVDLLAALRERATAEALARDAGTQPRDGPTLYPDARRALWRQYFLDSDHLTPAGHALVADVLAPLFDVARPDAAGTMAAMPDGRP